ncbi:MAG TPA: dehydrogenase [Desulfobacteraceae bacterium]|nr:dehydrogenase [Desulfobacteraceae bacterium]
MAFFLQREARKMRIKAAVLREFNKPVTIEDVDLASPKDDEVLVRTLYTGFCHSDLHFIRGTIDFGLPGVIGHEASGVVEDVGSAVTSVKKGDHVVAAWLIPCGHCPECESGQIHICRKNTTIFKKGVLPDMTTRFTDSRGGKLGHQIFVSGFAEYMVLPERGAIKIREDMPMDQACFLGCCMPTGFGAVYNVANVRPGQSVAIWGMGGVGLNVVRGAKLRSANPIIGVDLEGSKESIAREFGVTHFINNSKEDPVPIIQQLTEGGADYTFEVIGDPGAITQASWALGLGGKHIQVGVTPPDKLTGLPLTFFVGQSKSLMGVNYGHIKPHQDIPSFADMAMNGDLC